jgi:hypothetical protein
MLRRDVLAVLVDIRHACVLVGDDALLAAAGASAWHPPATYSTGRRDVDV